jgi:hypothetical protein
MKVVIPENIGEINLWQYQLYDELMQKEMSDFDKEIRKVGIFTELSVSNVKLIPKSDFQRISNQIDKALELSPEFQNTFTLESNEFGFIPNFDKITIGEFADLSKYGVKVEDLHYTMAILFRPITNKKDNKYSILPYNGTEEWADYMRKMPLHIALGSLVFFWNLANELQDFTQKFLSEELQREIRLNNTLLISGGIQRLKNWLKTTF